MAKACSLLPSEVCLLFQGRVIKGDFHKLSEFNLKRGSKVIVTKKKVFSEKICGVREFNSSFAAGTLVYSSMSDAPPSQAFFQYASD